MPAANAAYSSIEYLANAFNYPLEARVSVMAKIAQRDEEFLKSFPDGGCRAGCGRITQLRTGHHGSAADDGVGGRLQVVQRTARDGI